MIRRVAVIIPAADEEERIGRCLRSVAAARRRLCDSGADVDVDTVIVLDRCRDATGEVARAFGVQTVAVGARNVGVARWTGARSALDRAGPAGQLWLASTDADSEVPVDWLTSMLAEARRGAHLVLGTVLPGTHLGPVDRASWLSRHHLDDGHPHVHGANLGIRGDVYLDLGGWRPLVSGEDMDLAGRAALAGPRIARTAAIPVVTSARWTGRAPCGFSSYLRALGPPLPGWHPSPLPGRRVGPPPGRQARRAVGSARSDGGR